MTSTPKEPPEQSAPRVVAAFFVEFLPHVQKEYELLVKGGEGPLSISLPDLQLETLIFGLHCLDRAVFAHFGVEYRAVFMDHAFGAACDAFAAVLPEDIGGPFVELFDKQCRARQQDYGAMRLLPAEDGALKGVLCWEFAKRICLAAGVSEPLVLKVMIEEANSILGMMNKIAQTL